MLRALRFGVATSLFLLSAVGARAADDVMVVFDGSNSMWGQIGGVPKIEIARKAMSSLLGDWTQDTNIGLMAYGHRREGDCTDIETLIQPGPLNRAAFMSTVNGITPRGRTPLTSAVEMAAKVLSYRDNPATVVLISDGIESCDRDPCALADTLEKTGVRFTAHVVGFGLGGGDQRSLACIAEKTGGKFLTAANAGELNSALREVGSQVTKAAPPEPAPVPDVRLTAPETVEAGSGFQVGWTPTVNADDVITMVPADAPADRTGPTVRAGSGSPAQVQAPDAAGMFQLRYILADGGQVLARAPVQVTKAPEVALSVPATVETGADFQAGWDKTIAARDLVTIVPMGAKPNEIGAYKRAESGNPATLRAPSDPGLYEVRYVLDDGRRIAGRARVEVTEPQVRVDGPDSVLAGSDFEMSWDKTINKRDILTIVPMGADEDEIGDHKRASDGSPVTLRAPSQPGMYQLRYVLDEGRRVMASTQVEVTEPEVTLTATEKVRAKDEIDVSWEGDVPSSRDIVTIVPLGAAEDEIGQHFRVGADSAGTLKAPEQTGLFEVRYVLDIGRRVLARAQVEVVDENAAMNAGAVLDVPETAAPGATVEVTWTGGGDGGDRRIALAGADAADFTWIEAHKVNNEPPMRFTMPDAPGFYEFRFLDIANAKVLSRAIVEVK